MGRSGEAGGAVRHAGLVGASLLLWAIGSYAYFLIAGRVVGPATYGLVSALIGVLAIITWPCTALQWSTARTLASSTGDRADAMAAYRRALMRTWIASIALGAAGVLAIVVAHVFSDAVPTWALVATCLSAVPILPFHVAIGALQGESRYAGYSASWAASGLLRAPLMLPFLAVAAGSAAAVLLGSGLAMLVGLVMAMWLTWDDLRVTRPPSKEVWSQFTAGLGSTVAGLVGFASLVSLGVVVAKLRLPADDAGYYGSANTLGRAILMVPHAVAIILLPRVARRRSGDLPTGALLAVGSATTLAVGFAGAALAAVIGLQVMNLTFGSAYDPAADLLPQILVASTLIGVVFVLVNHHVARGDRRFSWAVSVVAVLHLVVLAAFGASANAIIAIDALAAIIIILGHEIMYWGKDDSLLAGALQLVAGSEAKTKVTHASGR